MSRTESRVAWPHPAIAKHERDSVHEEVVQIRRQPAVALRHRMPIVQPAIVRPETEQRDQIDQTL